MTVCITTFSKDGYELYGHKMIQTWLKYWPESYKLVVYTEGYNLVEKDNRLTEYDLELVCPNLLVFKEKSFNLLKDETDNKIKKRIQKTVKWSHKVYAMSHALTLENNYLIFLDGDTYTVNSVDANLPQTLVKNHLMAVHFENLKDGLHFETGLIVFNLQHSQMQKLKEQLTLGYDSLDIYNMHKTWDGYWFAHLYKQYNLDILDLSKEGGGVFGNRYIKNILKHDVGGQKYLRAGYNKFTGRKQ